MKKAILVTAIVGVALFGIVACSKGPAEKAGQSVDNATNTVVHAVTPAGPVEKAGKKLDQAVQSTKDAVTPAGPMQQAGQKTDQALGTQ